MVIKNKSRGTIITTDYKEAISLKDQGLGLLLKSNPRSLLFNTRFGIHTFGLKMPIDVIVLDQNLRVVKLKSGLKPNKLFFWNPKYNLVIELPVNTIKKSETKPGDQIEIV